MRHSSPHSRVAPPASGSCLYVSSRRQFCWRWQSRGCGRTTGRTHAVTRDFRGSRDTAARRLRDSDRWNTRCACLTLECVLAASRMAVLRDRGNSGYRARAAWTRRLVNRRSSLRLEAHRDSRSKKIRSAPLMSMSPSSLGDNRKLKAGPFPPELSAISAVQGCPRWANVLQTATAAGDETGAQNALAVVSSGSAS